MLSSKLGAKKDLQMIKLAQDNIVIKDGVRELIESRMSSNTCKTNLSPQLMFKQSYTGLTDKTFVGNWTKDGFWISKFRRQLMELRPDIIVRFDFHKQKNQTILKLRYSIGFSSILMGLIWILFISSAFSIPFRNGFIIVFTLFLIAYIILTLNCLNNTKSKIKEKIFSGN